MNAHTRWDLTGDLTNDPDYRAAGWRMALAQVTYQQRTARGWSESDLAERTGLTVEQVEEIEESSVYPTVDVLTVLGHAFHADAFLATAEEGQEGITFTPRAA